MACLDDSVLPFLHGTLVINILEARDLPDCDRYLPYPPYFSHKIREKWNKSIKKVQEHAIDTREIVRNRNVASGSGLAYIRNRMVNLSYTQKNFSNPL
jgi:hypothetical protein